MDDKLVYHGRTFRASDQSLRSASAIQEDSLTAESLAVDTLTAEVDDYFITPRVLAAQGLPVAAGGLLCYAAEEKPVLSPNDYGDVVEYYRGDSLLLKHYLGKPTRVGPTRWRLSCVSGIGLLLNSNHWGGIYTGQPLQELVADIIGGIIPYTLDETLGEMPMYGWLPKDTRRNNLRMALFASGGVVGKDANGDLTILPSTQPEPYPISPSRIYMGGSVAGVTPASAVAVTEHSYIALETDERVTLYEGEASGAELTTPKGRQVTGVLVEFNDPMHDLQAVNTEILERGANYAVIGSSASCAITGQKYNHTQRVITRAVLGAVTPNVVSSSKCGLVNALNSESVAARLTAYYAATRDVEIDLVVEGQKPGDAVTFTDPFGDDVTGYIRSLDLTMSGILKGSGRIADGYIPTASGNYYTKMVKLMKDGAWIVPDGVYTIRVVIIGGGDGGSAGQPGTDGKGGRNYEGGVTPKPYGESGEGGAAGTPGNGGKILVLTLSVKPGQIFSCSIGHGGSAGTPTEEPGLGQATTFGAYSSEQGTISLTGYLGLIDSVVYAAPGEAGVPGGDGTSLDAPETSVTAGGETWVSGAFGGNYNGNTTKNYGGCGGGPAVGANGSPGEAAFLRHAGNGGKGADAENRTASEIPGTGGHAGHGGGGGGGGGYQENHDLYPDINLGGTGGRPGNGASGADGAILIFL